MFDAPPQSAPRDMPARIEAETPADAADVQALILAAFGPGRFAKTAERVRERARIAAGFVARERGQVIGSVRLWRIMVGETAAMFLGPIAVVSDSRKAGLGAELVQACVEYSARHGVGILLVGDLSYFERFGFSAVPELQFPGPVDRRRLLWRGEREPTGTVRPIRQDPN